MDAPATPPFERLRRFTADTLPCKICGGPAKPFGGADFNRSCEEARGQYLVSAGVLIVYRRCEACGFLYTDAFDDWSPDDFAAEIYNDDYGKVDPEYDAVRPAATAKELIAIFGAHRATLRVLDYGGGNGRFAEQLRAAGFAAVTTYDPFNPSHQARPDGRFNLVTCFEAMEHLAHPAREVADLVSFLDEDSLLVFSTQVQPPAFDKLGMRWWYIGPRNGHISLYSREALQRLFAGLGLEMVSMSEGMHIAFRKPPSFIRFAQRQT